MSLQEAWVGEIGRTIRGNAGLTGFSTGSTLTLMLLKPDGTVLSVTPTSASTATGDFTYTTTASTDLNVEGNYLCQLFIEDGGDELWSPVFPLAVQMPLSGTAGTGTGWALLSQDDIQDLIDASTALCSGGGVTTQTVQTMIDNEVAVHCTGGTGSLGAWTDITYAAEDFLGDGLCDFTPSGDVDPWHYKMLDNETMVLELSHWGAIVTSTTYTYCGYFQVKMPNNKRPKKYGTYPCNIGLPAGSPAQYGGGYYPCWVYADPTYNGWLRIYADMNLWASTSSVDAGVFPVDAHGFDMAFSIMMQVEDVPA